MMLPSLGVVWAIRIPVVGRREQLALGIGRSTTATPEVEEGKSCIMPGCEILNVALMLPPGP